ncbi:hypothetical protein AX15_005714 [Amanita polypyramis BW_CC]|nr:hypothetical protein AX15_005714 [Amanita polypyramis BW_CC]
MLKPKFLQVARAMILGDISRKKHRHKDLQENDKKKRCKADVSSQVDSPEHLKEEKKKKRKHSESEKASSTSQSSQKTDDPKKKKKREIEPESSASVHIQPDEISSRKNKKRRNRDDTIDENPFELWKAKKKKKKHNEENLETSLSATLSEPEENGTELNQTSPSPEKVSEFLIKHAITIDAPSGVENPTPTISFAQLDIPDQLRTAFSGFKEPTPIQACTWPSALKGYDVVGIAETGSGKTLAFGIPALARLVRCPATQKKKSTSTVSVLVVAPTRELAIQTHDTLSALGKPFDIASVAVFGGVPKEPQVKMLRNASKAKDGMTTRIIVGTPGRILDLMQEGACDLGGVDYLVLDEADRMLDKGFENDIRTIILSTKQGTERQTMMFSATWPEAVRRLASTFQRNPIRVTVGSDDLTANSRVEQILQVLDDSRQKDSLLLDTLRSLSLKKKPTGSSDSRALVFALYKKEAARLEQMLKRQGYTVSALHGDMSQNARMEMLGMFKSGQVNLMVATDVAARGLDIPNVGAVINYTFPLTIEDYIHRIGRTGRGGNSGKSITFFTGENHERSLAGEFARVLREGGFDYEGLKRFPMTIKKKEHGAYGAFYRDDIPVPKGSTKIVFN